jgi:anion-transporting  ArsA/GET3 family ATPase
VNDRLAAGVAAHLFLKEQLREQFPDEDDDGLADTLEGMSALPEQIGAVVRSSDLDMALVEAIAKRMKELEARQQRLTHRFDTKRRLVAEAMERAGLRRVEAYDATITLAQKPAAVIITDRAAIPAAYLRLPPLVEPQPDKAAILAALKQGAEVPGAVLSNGGQRLSVRKS